MPPPKPRVKFTTEVAGRLREEVHHRRKRIIQAVTAMLEDLPREAGGLLDTRPPPGYPSTCFHWPKVFLDGEILWRLDCIVSKAGWPNLLWVVDVLARDLAE